MDNDLLDWESDSLLFFSLYLSIFLSFKAKFVSQYSHQLYKLESSNMVYICRMFDCYFVVSQFSEELLKLEPWN